MVKIRPNNNKAVSKKTLILRLGPCLNRAKPQEQTIRKDFKKEQTAK